MNNKLTRSQRRDAGETTPVDYEPWSQQLSRLRNEIDRLFGSPIQNFLGPAAASMFEGWGPSVDLCEDKDRYVLRAELPGMKKEDIEVHVEGNTLTIAGEKRHEEHDKERRGAYRSERFFGRFQRSLTLPAQVDATRIDAQYKDGVLTLNLPKSEEAKRKQIAVKVS